MQKRLIKIGTITYALKIKKALYSLGIRVRVIRTSADSNGCAYSIEFPEEHLLTVIAELKKHGIKYELNEEYRILP